MRWTVSLLFVAALLALLPATISLEQNLIVTTDPNGYHALGTYRAPIELDRPVTWLLEIERASGTLSYVSYTTPPITLRSHQYTLNGTSRVRVRAYRFETTYTGVYRNVSVKLNRTVPSSSILTPVDARQTPNGTELTFDLDRNRTILIIENRSEIGIRAALPTPRGPIILNAQKPAIGNASYDGNAIHVTLTEPAELTVSFPFELGRFVPSAIGPTDVIGTPRGTNTIFRLQAGTYTIPIRTNATPIVINRTALPVPGLAAGANTTVKFTWIAALGIYRFTATADANGTVAEANESNNNLSRNHSISSYQIDYGKVDFSKFLSNAAMQTYKNWSVAKPTGTIYYADADASYFAFNLKPLNGTNDLVEADQALGMTYFNDSISNLWDSNHDGIPDRTATFWIAGVQVSNVPIINSTPGDPFITGIMWDSADGGSQYNGSQDLVFVTRINASTAGAYGTYDYEIRVPSRLKYQISGTNLVDRLTEIE